MITGLGGTEECVFLYGTLQKDFLHSEAASERAIVAVMNGYERSTLGPGWHGQAESD